MRNKLFWSIGLTVVAVCCAWFGYRVLLPVVYPLEIDGIYLDEPIAIDEFALTDHSRQTFNRERFRDLWSFLYLGYTHCPDACPMTLAQLDQVENQLSEQGRVKDTAYWFISVDPRRDSLETLAQYAGYFNPKFNGATGTQDQIETLSLQLGAFYAVPKAPEDPLNYTVSHPVDVYLINPDMELQAVFKAPLETNRMTADFIRIRQRYEHLN